MCKDLSQNSTYMISFFRSYSVNYIWYHFSNFPAYQMQSYLVNYIWYHFSSFSNKCILPWNYSNHFSSFCWHIILENYSKLLRIMKNTKQSDFCPKNTIIKLITNLQNFPIKNKHLWTYFCAAKAKIWLWSNHLLQLAWGNEWFLINFW